MNYELIIVLGLTAVALALFVSERLRVEVVALLVLSVLLLTRVLEPSEGFSGFSNEATVAIGAMFVLSEGLRKTGVLRRVASLLGRLFEYQQELALFAMMTGAAVVSAFINNVAVVAIMLPMVLSVSRKTGVSPSRLLIPLSFAAMFGGSTTLIGTSSNLLVSGLIAERGLDPIGMFEVTPVGLLFFLVGTVYLMTVGRWLLPDRGSGELRETRELADFRAQVEVVEGAKCVGRRASEFFLDSRGKVVAVQRGGNLVTEDLEEIVIEVGDVLRIAAPVHLLQELDAVTGQRLLPLEPADDDREGVAEGEEAGKALLEIVLAPDSTVVGRTLREAGFEQHHPAHVIAMRRRGEVVVQDLLDIRLQGGDGLLFQVPPEHDGALQRRRDFIVISEFGVPEYKTRMTIPVILILAGIVVGAAIEWMPIVTLAVVGCVLLVLMRVLTMEEAYRAIDWQVIFLLGGFIPLGLALEQTGAIDLVAHGLVQGLGGAGPVVLLAGFYFATNFMSDVVSNQATAVLMTPVAVVTAMSMGGDPRPFIMAIAFASSDSFASPVGYHTNVMIYGVGNYRFLDFVKVGLPLNLLFLGTAVVAIPVIWSL